MLTHEVFIHQIIVDGIQRRLIPRAIHAIRATLHDTVKCYVPCIVRILVRMARVDTRQCLGVCSGSTAQRFDNHLPVFSLVLALHFFFA